MKDERKTIGSGGTPGRGNRETSPSAAARSLAGGAAAPRKPAAKKKAPAAAKGTPTPPKASAAPKDPTAPTATAPESPVTPTAPPSGKPHLRAVTDEDAAAAAAAAAEEAARRTRTAGAAPQPAGIPLDEIFVAVIEAAQRVLGSDWEVRVATLLATIRKRLSGDYEVDEFGFDPQIAEVLAAAIEPLAEKWFRLEVRGVENIPEEGGALLVANHSGTVPLDGLITGYAVKKYAQRDLRPLGADLVFALPGVGQVARKVGATLACQEDAERLLTGGHLAGVWPEGFKGIGKPFAERYKLQRFGRGGFVSSAMRAGVPIVPVSIVGAEEIYPLVGNVPSLARLLGLPYLPITPFFPLLGPLGLIPLPSKWIIEFGEPIRTDAYEPEAADDPMLLFNVTDQVRETIQQTLYKLLVDRGNAFF
ncbi:lysophospholipid acyltransferase family protein [Aeromicrobium chenweiae]|uniref:Glycerol acyltransferase n=1 Tax=Aeromicrobium chenweiae TaxID=2079793 RepID=A0A2S0WQF8_9ACTN|nr:lysophospholipid acyltransferase family protein [Aeromicrobium chenweiae]AWB93557.1 glycerol acyltransferase [Aeromicrobium chenweiae]TGN33206.1 glycerol acyltransferase [Aeromicrobium chenweiae]